MDRYKRIKLNIQRFATMEASQSGSGPSSMKLRLTYTTSNGSITMTKMEGTRTSAVTSGNQTNIIVNGTEIRHGGWSYWNNGTWGTVWEGSYTVSGTGSVVVTFTGSNITNIANSKFQFTIITPPSVADLIASNVTSNSATLSFEITYSGGDTATGHITCNGQTKNSTSASFTGLTRYTEYTAKAYASNSQGNSSELSLTFRTLAELPTMSLSITNTSPTSISGTKSVDDNGGATVTVSKVQIATDSEFQNIIEEKTDNNFEFDNLTPHTTYYLRSYGTNVRGTGYSSTEEITTYGGVYVSVNGGTFESKKVYVSINGGQYIDMTGKIHHI